MRICSGCRIRLIHSLTKRRRHLSLSLSLPLLPQSRDREGQTMQFAIWARPYLQAKSRQHRRYRSTESQCRKLNDFSIRAFAVYHVEQHTTCKVHKVQSHPVVISILQPEKLGAGLPQSALRPLHGSVYPRRLVAELGLVRFAKEPPILLLLYCSTVHADS